MSKYAENPHHPRIFSDDRINAKMLEDMKLMREIHRIIKQDIDNRVSLSQFGNIIQALTNSGTALKVGSEIIAPVPWRSARYWTDVEADDTRLAIMRIIEIPEE